MSENLDFLDEYSTPSQEEDLDNLDFLDDVSVTSSPSYRDKAREFALGAAEEYPKAATALVSGIQGAKTLSKIPGPPPLKILSGGLGFVGGTGAGYFIADEAIGLLDEEFDLFPVPNREDLIPYREGGSTFGASLSTFPAVYSLPAKTSGRISEWLSGIRNYAVNNPKSFLTMEGLGAIGSSYGVVEFSTMKGPEENYQLSGMERFGAEVTGGVAFGNQFISKAAFTLGDFLKNRVSSVVGGEASKTLNTKAANKLIEMIEEAGENPEKILKLLEKETGYSSLTSAQKTGSPVLSLLEKQIVSKSPVYAGVAEKNVKKTIEENLAFIKQLELFAEKNNSPEIFKQAVALRKKYYDDQLAARVDLAFAESARAISKITKDTPQARAQIGDIVKTNITKSLEDARDLERKLWLDAYRSGFTGLKIGKPELLLRAKEVKPRQLVKKFVDFAASRNPDLEPLDPRINKIFSKMGITNEDIVKYRTGMASEGYLETGTMPEKFLPNFEKIKEMPVNELVDLRSAFLRVAREAAADNRAKADGRFFGGLAEATLDDLSNPQLGQAYDVARNYSRKLNDVYTRTFIDDIGSVRQTGRERMPAELVVGKAFGSNADINFLRMNQIEDAARFLIDRNRLYPKGAQADKLAEAQIRFASIKDAQARILRLAAAESIEETTDELGRKTQRLNLKKLTRFIDKNKDLLRKSEVLPDLQNAVTAEEILMQVTNKSSALNKKLNNEAFFLKALNYDSQISPTALIAEALNSKKPLTNINQLVKTAKRFDAKNGTTAATDGLKSIIMDYAFTSAMSRENVFNPARFNEVFFGTIRPTMKEGLSLSKVLRANNLMSGKEISNLKKLLVPMMRIQRAMLVRGTGSDLVLADEASAVADFVMRTTGAKIGSDVGGGTLIAASAGSKAVRNIFDKMPKMMASQVIEEAIKDPQFMATLLKKAKTEKDRINIARSMNGWLFGAGLRYGVEDEEYPEEEMMQLDNIDSPLIEPSGRLPYTPSNLPPKGPPTRGLETGIDSQLISSANTPAQSSSKQMLQSLFPLDPVLGAGRPPSA